MPAPEYCLLWIDWWPLCMTKAEWSGWVQAIGSVAAIGLSVWVVQRQHRLELRRQAIADWHAKRVALQGALQTMSGVLGVADKVANIARHRAPVLMDLFHLTIELEVMVNALARADYLKFETHSAIEGLTVTEAWAEHSSGMLKPGTSRLEKGHSTSGKASSQWQVNVWTE